jgi:hypothetical protein
MRTIWAPVIERAAEIVTSYDTGVTLRQLFYRLVSEQLIPNRQTAYSQLSELTAIARRAGTFPDLIDRGREIHRPVYFDHVDDALASLAGQYRLDRTEGQDVSLYLGVEKSGMIEQLSAWFGDLGLPVVPLGGFSSQTYVKDVITDASAQERPAVLLYAGDFDASGEDIDRDFEARTGCWTKVVRVALSAAQVDQYRLPKLPGKDKDSRNDAFIERHGELVQVELDALEPGDLRSLFTEAIAPFLDVSSYERIRTQERADLQELRSIAERES